MDHFLNYIYDEMEKDILQAENDSEQLKEANKELERQYQKIRKRLKSEKYLMNSYDAQVNLVTSLKYDILMKHCILRFVRHLKELKIL